MRKLGRRDEPPPAEHFPYRQGWCTPGGMGGLGALGPKGAGDVVARGREGGENVLARAYSRGMARTTVFVCSQCGHDSAKWHGRCPGCGEWNSMVEERAPEAAPGGGRSPSSRSKRALKPVPLAQVEAPALRRLATGIGELDRVLGGGLVPGSMVLIGGSPGIGKSTITGGALGNLAGAGRRVLYVSGEESAAQVKLRAERLGADALRVPIVAETDLEAVEATIEAEAPEVCVVDSV